MARQRGVRASWFGQELHVTLEGPLDRAMVSLTVQLLEIMQATAPEPARAVVIHTDRLHRVDPLAGRLLRERLREPWPDVATVLFVGRRADEVPLLAAALN